MPLPVGVGMGQYTSGGNGLNRPIQKGGTSDENNGDITYAFGSIFAEYLSPRVHTPASP